MSHLRTHAFQCLLCRLDQCHISCLFDLDGDMVCDVGRLVVVILGEGGRRRNKGYESGRTLYRLVLPHTVVRISKVKTASLSRFASLMIVSAPIVLADRSACKSDSVDTSRLT